MKNPFRKILLLMTLAALLSSCNPTPAAQTSAVSETSEVLPTPTPVPPTETPTPTPTETPIISEADLKPAYTEHVQMSFMGAEVDVSLITDGSLDPIIRKVTVGEKAYAEFMTRSVYSVYQHYHPDVTYEQYMQMLAEVQSGQRDPLEIAIPVYANDVNDGVPYQKPDKSVNPAAQKKYLIIPWYQGDAPESVDGVEMRAVSEINIALVNGKKVKNLTIVRENGGELWGIGTNLDKDVLNFYNVITFIDSVENRATNTASAISEFKKWLTINIGRQYTGRFYFVDNNLYNLLITP